jgi:hypothetical protein
LEVDGVFTCRPWLLKGRILKTSPQSEITLLPGKLVGGFEAEALLCSERRLCPKAILFIPPIRSNPGSRRHVIGRTPKKPLDCSPYRMANYKLLKSKPAGIDRMGILH